MPCPLRHSISLYLVSLIQQSNLSSPLINAFYSNQSTSVAPRSRGTRELVALRLEGLCSVLFRPIHL